jgi:hypothetical protein
MSTRRASGLRLEDHGLALGRKKPEPRSNGQDVGREYERTRPAPCAHDLLQLAGPHGDAWLRVRDERPRSLNRTDSHQAGRFQAAAPRRGSIVDLEAGRVTAVAGRRVAMANQCNMATLEERGPGVLGVIGGHTRGDEQRNGKKGGS